jgi:hypothetical protein
MCFFPGANGNGEKQLKDASTKLMISINQKPMKREITLARNVKHNILRLMFVKKNHY